MLDERPTGAAVLSTPFDIRKFDAVAFYQQPRTAIGERIDHRRGAEGRVVVELGARAIDIAGVKKFTKPIVGAVEGAADEGCNMRGLQEAMARE